MSTKATRATLQDFIDRLEDTLAEAGLSKHQRETTEHRLKLARESEAEVEAIEKAAKDLDRMAVGDFTYAIRDRAASDKAFTGNTWEHPNVKAWGDASVLMGVIAKDAP